MQQEVDLVKRIVEALDQGVVALTHEGSLLSMNNRARQWLADYLGDRSLLANRLPETLERWVGYSPLHGISLTSFQMPLIPDNAGSPQPTRRRDGSWLGGDLSSRWLTSKGIFYHNHL